MIDILSWGSKKNFEYYPSCSLLKNQYLDIKFMVFIADHTLKFLPFDLAVNGEDFFLILPLTLLNMTSVYPSSSPY